MVFRVYKSDDPAVQALIKGEVDFVEGLSALQVQSLEGHEGITAHNGDSPSFDEIAFNTGSVDIETGEPIGDPNPAVLDPAFRYALDFAIDREQLIRTVYQGAGKPGTTIIPPAYGDYLWTPPEDDAFAFDLDKAGQLLDEAGYTVGADGKRTLPDGDPIGTLRLAARSDSQTSVDVMDYFKEWLGDLGIDAEVQAFESSKLTDVILEGRLRRLRVGLVRRARPGLDAQLHDLRPARELVGLVVLQRGVRRALRAAARRDGRRDPAGPGQADAGAPLPGRAVPRDGVLLHRRGVPQRPVRLLPAAARPGRRLAGPVRRPQLPQHAAGRRRRRLRRHRRPPSAQAARRPPPTAAAATTA